MPKFRKDRIPRTRGAGPAEPEAVKVDIPHITWGCSVEAINKILEIFPTISGVGPRDKFKDKFSVFPTLRGDIDPWYNIISGIFFISSMTLLWRSQSKWRRRCLRKEDFR